MSTLTRKQDPVSRYRAPPATSDFSEVLAPPMPYLRRRGGLTMHLHIADDHRGVAEGIGALLAGQFEQISLRLESRGGRGSID